MRISILTDLLRLAAHDSDTHYAFGASFAPAFEGDAGEKVPHDVFTCDVKGLDANQSRPILGKRAGPLVPWTWEKVGLRVWVKPDPKNPITPMDIELPSKRDIDKDSLKLIEKKIVDHCVSGIENKPAEPPDWHPLLGPQSQSELPANAFLYAAFLQSAATLPAPVPHGRLNFVRFFLVKKSDIAATEQIAAAPVFEVSGQAFDSFDSLAIATGEATAAYAHKWTSSEMTDVPVEARCRTCAVEVKDSKGSFLDLKTLWLRDKLPTGGDSLSQDAWFEELPVRLGATFDLATRLVEALAKPNPEITLPEYPLSGFRKALLDQAGKEAGKLIVLLVLRALHDRLGPAYPVDIVGQGALLHRLFPHIQGLETETRKVLAKLATDMPAFLKEERSEATWSKQGKGFMRWVDRLARRVGSATGLPETGAEFVKALLARTAASEDPTQPFVVNQLATVVSVTSTDVLANILADTWAAVAPGQLFAQLEAGGLRTRLVDSLVDTRMRRALLDPAWVSPEGLFKRPDTPENDLLTLVNNTTRSLGDYGLGTVARTDVEKGCESEYAEQFVRTSLLTDRAALRAVLESEAKATLGDLKTSASLVSGSGKAAVSTAPGGITIQFDRVIRGPEDASKGDDDFNLDLAGYGILGRRTIPKYQEPWRGLSVVNLALDETTGNPLLQTDATRIETVAALVPVYDGDMPTAATNYDNRPVVGRARVERRTTEQKGGDPGTTPDVVPLLVSLQPLPDAGSDPRSEAAKLPFLAFGVDVQLAVFGQTNHGAIPRELTEGFPALLPDDRNNLMVPEKIDGINIIRTIPYRRRVGVGALKLLKLSKNVVHRAGNEWNAFAIPPGVRLIADELPETGMPAEPVGAPNQPAKRPMPRALLLSSQPSKRRTTFEVRAPSADIEVFDRWLAYDELLALSNSDQMKREQIRTYRKAIRDRFDEAVLTRARQDQATEGVSDDDKHSPGDPAIESFIVRATRIFKDGKQDSKIERKVIPWSLAIEELLSNPATLENTHRKAIKIQLVQQDNASGPQLVVSGQVATLTIDRGEVWKVELAAGVAEMQIGAGGRFSDIFTDTAVGGFFPVSLFSFALEGGTIELPSETEVFDAFVPGVDVAGRIAFQWNREATRKSAAVGAITVGWQQWRFTGRSTAPFPYGALGDLDKLPAGKPVNRLEYPVLWETEGFADRPEEPSRSRRFEPRLTVGVVDLGAEIPSPPMPARYIRFQIKAESRYAPAYDPPERPDPVTGVCQGTGEWRTAWKRLFRPAIPLSIPPLTIRAVVPLTRALRNAQGKPGNLGGVLLVVDGAIGETGGIVETIEVRPLRITRNLDGGSASAMEFGPDPILRRTSDLAPKDAKDVPEYTKAAGDLRVVGPIGHTFDFEAKAPAFHASSFIVSPPAVVERDPGAGWMARVRSRRLLEPRGVATFGDDVKLFPADKKKSVPIPLGASGDVSLTFSELGLSTTNKKVLITCQAQMEGGLALSEKVDIEVTAKVESNAINAVEVVFRPEKSEEVSVTVPEPLRSLRLLVVRSRSQLDGRLVDRYETGLEAETETGQLVRTGELSFEDDRATGAVQLVLTAPKDTRLTTLRAPLASAWTETGWVQFLPDTTVSFRSNDLPVNIKGFKDRKGRLEIEPGAGLAWRSFVGLLGRSGKKDQGLVHFLMVTQTVPSFAGEGRDEAYVGLYVLERMKDNKPLFVRFGGKDDKNNDISQIAADRLRARIMMVQADPRVWSSDGKNKDEKELLAWLAEFPDEWEPFFPREDSDGRGLAEPVARDALLAPADARMRIRTMFAPFSIKKRCE